MAKSNEKCACPINVDTVSYMIRRIGEQSELVDKLEMSGNRG